MFSREEPLMTSDPFVKPIILRMYITLAGMKHQLTRELLKSHTLHGSFTRRSFGDMVY